MRKAARTGAGRAGKDLTAKQKRELSALAAMSDDQIDTSDIPELPPAAWKDAVRGRFYRHELKFTTGQSGASDVDVFYRKIQEKADNTMGIMVSISGYSSVAINAASGPRTLVLLMDHSHLYLLLTGSTTFAELIGRVRRHASQTGRAYLAVADFGR